MTQAKTNPCWTKGWKSGVLIVANLAPQRIATEAIMQSASERERRPVLLKSRAANSASGPERASTCENICRAISSSRAESGPQKSSAHATADVPRISLPLSHEFTFAASAGPGLQGTDKEIGIQVDHGSQGLYRRASRIASIQALALAASRLRLF